MFSCRSLILSLLLPAALAFGGAPSPDLWKLGPIAPSELNVRLANVDQGAISVPTAARPAVEFQKILVRISANAPASEWLPEMEKFAKAGGEDPVAKALCELALNWQARGRMQEIDKALRKYYREAVHFPEHLEEIRAGIPAAAKNDPWGEPWVYKSAAPQGFANLVKQRYQLGPTRNPQLSTIQQFLEGTPPVRAWKLTGKEIGGAKALDVRTPDGKAAVVQAGGKISDATVAFIGDGWALFADSERLFSLPY